MQYTIKYEYEWWEEGCGCCTDSSSEVHIYEEHRVEEGVYTSHFGVPIMEDEDELRAYFADNHPEYNGFVVHEDTRWY